MSSNEMLPSQLSTGRQPKTSVNMNKAERVVSTIGGGALIAYGLKRRSPLGFLLAGIGASLLYRGASGHCMTYQALGISTARKNETEVPRDVHVEEEITINKAAPELYKFWRQIENLPRFSKYVQSVVPIDEKRSRWTVNGPAGIPITWEAEIFNEKPNELIAWRTLPTSDIANAGSVHFIPLAGRGTIVKVTLNYNPPAGKIGGSIAEVLGIDPGELIREDLRRFKEYGEGREIGATMDQGARHASASGAVS